MEQKLNQLGQTLAKLRTTLFRPGADTRLDSFGMTGRLERKFRAKRYQTFEDLRGLSMEEVRKWLAEDEIRENDVNHLNAQIEAAILTHEEKTEGLGKRKPGQGKDKLTWNKVLPRLRVTVNALAAGIMRHSEAQADLDNYPMAEIADYEGLTAALRAMDKKDIPSLQSLNTKKLRELAATHEFEPEHVERFRARLEALVKKHFVD